MKRVSKSTLWAVPLVVFPFAGRSELPPPPAVFTPPEFEEADGNRDQQLDRDEQGRIIIDRFDARDLNNDGSLAPGEMPPGSFADADMDQDKQVTKKEFMQFRFGIFERFDQDQNETLDHQEYRRWRDAQ